MLKNYLLFILLILMQMAFTQKRILLSGVVTTEGIPAKPVNVINYKTKLVVTPGTDGRFEIWARKDDLLIFMLDNYLDQQIIVSDDDLKNKIAVHLKKKPEELEEVKILQKPLGKYKVSQTDIDAIKLEKQITRPVNTSVYTGEIVNGIDFMRIGKGLIQMFKKKEDKKPQKPVINFKDYVRDNVKEDFFTKTLGLKPEQVYAFIDYCNDDPMAKTIVQNDNSLAVMDFLMEKIKAFKN